LYLGVFPDIFHLWLPGIGTVIVMVCHGAADGMGSDREWEWGLFMGYTQDKIELIRN